MIFRKWIFTSVCAFTMAAAAGGFWLWQRTKPIAKVWLRVHTMNACPGNPSTTELVAWVPAEPELARLATRQWEDMQANHWAVDGNFFGASLTYFDGPEGGGFRTALAPSWPSDSLQAITHDQVFAAEWTREEDGAIRLITRDPLTLPFRVPVRPDITVKDLWLEVEVPRHGGLKALALGVRSGSGSFQPFTF